MFKRCITKCGSTPDIQAFINEDGKLVVERSGPFISKQLIITSPAEMAGEWIVSEPEELHIPLPYGPQGLIYNRYVGLTMSGITSPRNRKKNRTR
ncbi:hypothetical protein [Escherichia coli]|uniref:hypothetical protein n=1 Tax=Escherichia coli TaxID=562 RepID=UPI0022FD7BD5|nr:hypothetical protein [Escherichia coli]WBZ65013.1 hypothetical protein PIC71_08460 [Escherichia coli]